MTRLLHELVSRTGGAAGRDAIAVVMRRARRQLRGARARRATGSPGRSREAGARPAIVLPVPAQVALAAIVAMPAASKADCVYVPIDLASPATRVARSSGRRSPRHPRGVIRPRACSMRSSPRGRRRRRSRSRSARSRPPDRRCAVVLRLTLDEVLAGSAAPCLACERTGADSRAHPLHVGLDRGSRRASSSPTQRAPVRRLGDGRTSATRAHGPHLGSSAAALRSVDVRHLRRRFAAGASSTSCRRSSTCCRTSWRSSSGRASSRSGSRSPRRSTYMARFDVVARGRFPRARANPLVRGGLADAGPHPLDGATSSCALHEPVRPDRGHDREQLLHGSGPAGDRDGADPDRDSVRWRRAPRAR